MFDFSRANLQNVLFTQANVFNSFHGAGDSYYECKDLTTGIYRERKSGIDRAVPKGFIATCNTQSNAYAKHDNNTYSYKQDRIDVNEVFNSYRLANTTGSQWTTWRDSNIRNKKTKRARLPPSPGVPHGELMMDLHDERMECLCYDLEEAPMALSG